MKGDFTRSTFRPRKHYSSVRMQQGRVQLDSDWNEQMDITARRVGTGTSDITGRYAVPFRNPGFMIGGGAVPSISKGHLYLDGFLIENDEDILITEQDEFLPGYSPSTAVGYYLAYLVTWERHVTALEDGLIREVALGGPDTTTRTQTVWQVRLLGPLATPPTCSSDPAEWQQIHNFIPGKLRARTASGTKSTNLCEVPAGAGYRRLENQLYRVEVHTAGQVGQATFKWSRDNGSIVTAWTDQDGSDLIITNPGRDQMLGFAAGQMVELTDDDRELRGEPGVLVKLSKVEGQVLTLDRSVPEVDLRSFGRNPKIRRWDSDLDTSTGTRTLRDWMPLEDGVEVRFEEDCYYETGDYWMIPARTSKSDIEWPADETDPTAPAAVVRQGIERHYCKLATLHFDARFFTVTGDCRPKFPPLTMLTGLYYVGGDGQSAMPNDELPQMLEVRVACGGWVIEGATVRFTAEGNGRLRKVGASESTGSPLDVDTEADGIARCYWKPDPNRNNPSQQVTAILIDADGNQVTNEARDLVQAIHFTANLSIAGQVAYESGECLLHVDTVKEALDELCRNYTLYYVGGDGQETMPGGKLLQPLQVRVANGDFPVENQVVVFEVVIGDGELAEWLQGEAGNKSSEKPGKKIAIKTNKEGLASCSWKVDEKNLSQRVAASLYDERHEERALVYFNANLSRAELVGIGDIPEGCDILAEAHTVQDALNLLCQAVKGTRRDAGVTIDAVFTFDAMRGPIPLLNDAEIGQQPLREGIVVACSEDIEPVSVNGKPVGYVTLDLPGKDLPLIGSAGYQTIGLYGSLLVEDDKPNEIRWQPDQRVIDWVSKVWEELDIDRVLVRFVLKGNFIWAKANPSRYLDANSFGEKAEMARTDIPFPTGNGHRGGDFEMWFWLLRNAPPLPTHVVGIVGITVDAPQAAGGSNMTGTVMLSGPAPDGGVAVAIEGAGAALAMPATVYIPAGATQVTFNIKTNDVSEITRTTLVASLGGATRQRTVTVSPKE